MAVVTLRLFAQARESVGASRVEFAASSVPTVGDVLDEAANRYGQSFVDVLGMSNVWLNGSPADRAMTVGDGDEVAVLPPVSGG
jgi:MoaD family protein